MLGGIHVRRLLRDQLTENEKIFGHSHSISRRCDIESCNSSSENGGSRKAALHSARTLRSRIAEQPPACVARSVALRARGLCPIKIQNHDVIAALHLRDDDLGRDRAGPVAPCE